MPDRYNMTQTLCIIVVAACKVLRVAEAFCPAAPACYCACLFRSGACLLNTSSCLSIGLQKMMTTLGLPCRNMLP